MKRLMYISLVVTMLVILTSGEAWARPWWWHWSPWGLWGQVRALKSAVSDLQQDNKAQEEQISALLEELALARGMVEDLTTRLGSAEIQIGEVTEGLAALQQGDITGFDTRLAKAEGKIGEVTEGLAAVQGEITGFDIRLATAEQGLRNVQDVSDLGKFVSVITEDEAINGVKGPHVIFEGVNVHVRSGSESTDDNGSLSGLGNLIIGYNEEPDDLDIEDREGSHNLVIGSRHRFSSWGGFVAGYDNIISGEYCTVSGGSSNQATHEGASVSGGGENLASAYLSSISGGKSNEASATGASVSGGGENHASEYLSSVSGGGHNLAGATGASVSGGSLNAAYGNLSSVSGGSGRVTEEHFSWAAGSLYEKQ